MEQLITFSELNDFMFCPMSLYYHGMYKGRNETTYQTTDQTAGRAAHQTVDEARLAPTDKVLQGIMVYSERYRLCGKIDTFYLDRGELVERKKKIKQIFDGNIFQIYAQIFGLAEMGIEVKLASFYSLDDHRRYKIALPWDDQETLTKFEAVIEAIYDFDPSHFKQTNPAKCARCIYAPICDQEVVC